MSGRKAPNEGKVEGEREPSEEPSEPEFCEDDGVENFPSLAQSLKENDETV